MRRKLLLISLAVFMFFSSGIAACGGSTTDSSKAESSPIESSKSVEESSAAASSKVESSEDIESSEEVESSETIESSEEAASSEEEQIEVTDYVDFVVDVEGGRDIRVLQLTDIQTISSDQKRYESRVGSSSVADTYNGYEKYVGQVIERYNPDLIIMTGDNTYGEFDDGGQQFSYLIDFMDSFEIPWAPVFGNHDNESNMGVDWQCEQFENSSYCLFKQRELTGNGNYSVGVTQEGELKRVFYMLDSNGCGAASKASLANGHTKTSAGFGDDQVDWYTKSMKAVKEVYPEAKLSMAFHIQIAAFGNAMAQYGYNSSTIRSNPINLDAIDEAKAKGDFGFIGREPKGAWDTSKVVWNTIKQNGVDSVFVGHEHCNSASIEYQGVRLTYGQKSSTFDRYNCLHEDGSIKDSGTGGGAPIMGGTYINLSQADGSIIDAGLYLYDHTLGYEKPEEDKITIDNIPENALVTELDFNGTDFDTKVTTSAISTMQTSKMADTQNAPEGFTGDVHSKTTNNFACVGMKFDKTLNADKLLAVFVKMYVSEYTVTAGKTPLLRIYNSTQNTILSEESYAALGGKMGKWIYVDILDLIKKASIVTDGAIAPFTLLYRFYGDTQGTVYFDSLTLVSNGNPYIFDEKEENVATVRGAEYKVHTLDEFEGASGTLNGGGTKFLALDENSYSIKFSLTPETYGGTFGVYAYNSESKPSSGIAVFITRNRVLINSAAISVSVAAGKTHEIEVGFVNLFDGNTVYVFVKIGDKLVAWELIEVYGKTPGNLAFTSTKKTDLFELA